MNLRNNTDQGFDDFRRQRARGRSRKPAASGLGYENQALRELEQVEEREVRDQQLTREVHDFFAAATKQAAAIVERVAHDAEEEAGERMQGEVEGFLIDTLSRMNGFIVGVMQHRRNANVAEAHVEPDIKHLVGAGLDEFRYEGSAETRDAHIGQDPFATPVEDVQREFRAVVADMDGEAAAAPIDDHLVAETSADETHEDDGDRYEEPPVASEQDDPAAASMPAEFARDAAEGVADTHSEMVAEEEPTVEEELETFKNALKALVRQGVMQREEARAAWNARLAKLGRAPA